MIMGKFFSQFAKGNIDFQRRETQDITFPPNCGPSSSKDSKDNHILKSKRGGDQGFGRLIHMSDLQVQV